MEDVLYIMTKAINHNFELRKYRGFGKSLHNHNVETTCIVRLSRAVTFSDVL